MIEENHSSVSAAKSSPRDVFMHLLATIALYISAASFGTLVYQYIDLKFPDPLGFGGTQDPIRWAIAALVIVFPAYLWVSWILARDVEALPEKAGLRVRRWLYAFTLFAAAVIIIGDLVALIFRFLNGDLTGRFILKVLTVLFIAGAVFLYYGWLFRTAIPALRHPRMRLFALGVIAIVAIATISGFFVSGSPFRERLRRFDERRVSDLVVIQAQIISYWQRKGALPGGLSDLDDSISGFRAPVDPETNEGYGYKETGDVNFELCADFKTASSEVQNGPRMPYGPYGTDNWNHGTGRVCFERAIDPDLYRIPAKGVPIPQ